MKKIICFIFCLTVATIFFASSANAIPLGTNITVNDQVNGSTSWYGSAANTSVAREDNEVETNCLTGQAWDMEAFFLEGYTLSMVSGFDLINGNGGFASGDVFIDIDGNAVYGTNNAGSNSNMNGNAIVSNTFGYDYALDLVFEQGGSYYYDVYALEGSSTVKVYYAQNDESNPWSYNDGGTWLGSSGITYSSNLTDAQVGNGLQGGLHNVAQFDLSFLKFDQEFMGNFTTHFTMGCGNDNLMGKGTAPVPEPATLLLLGSGLLGLAGFRKKSK